jgi:thiol-disulfide isomerase/thioredoxin
MKYLFQISKTIYSLIGILIVSFAFQSCSEIPPIIKFTDGSVGKKKVLVEEFTGVRCVNCPDGAIELENLKAIYKEQLIIVSIHEGGFSLPYTDSKYDFRTTKGTDMVKYIGAPSGYPSASVNRKLLPNQSQIPISKSKWAPAIADELQVPSDYQILLQKKYDSLSRKLTLNVQLLNANPTGKQHYITVLLKEDGVKDLQLDNNGKNYEYIHKNILRDVITAPSGDQIASIKDQKITLESTLSTNWNANNCKIIIFVHQSDVEKNILQCGEFDLK